MTLDLDISKNGLHFDLLSDRYQGRSHSVLLNPYEDPNLMSFLIRGREAYFSARDSGDQRLPTAIISEYVYRNIKASGQKSEQTHHKHFLNGKTPNLSEFVDGAACREKNLFAHLLLAQLGYPSEFRIGYIDDGKVMDTHAWNYVPITDEVVDAIMGKAIKSSSYYKIVTGEFRSPQILALPHHEIWGWSPFGRNFEFRRNN